MTLHLSRFSSTPMGTFGELTSPEHPDLYLYTIEPPWANNLPHVSCIPASRYTALRGRYWRGGYTTFIVQDVPNRKHILFHTGNALKDTHGCILVGNSLGVLNDDWAVTNSSGAFANLMAALEDESELLLSITWKACEGLTDMLV